jgi:hypothetical protein
MSLLNRYLSGETKQVYNDIHLLGSEAFRPGILPQVQEVLTETFTRAAHNLTVIYKDLRHLNYNFNENGQYDFEKPLIKPHPNVERLLCQLDQTVEPKGYVPLSLKYFYKIVGACNFAWDYESNAEILWEGADAVQVCPLNDLLESVIENFEDEIEGMDLAADYLHKINVSGGPAYAMEITEKPAIDGELLFEEHNTTFINYLRIVFDNCGFSRAYILDDEPTFIQYCNKVKPKLLPI